MGSATDGAHVRNRDHRRYQQDRIFLCSTRACGSVVEILLGMIILGILWYIVDGWILAPIERATGQRWGFGDVDV